MSACHVCRSSVGLASLVLELMVCSAIMDVFLLTPLSLHMGYVEVCLLGQPIALPVPATHIPQPSATRSILSAVLSKQPPLPLSALSPSKATGAVHLKQLKLVYVELPADLAANSPLHCTDAMHRPSLPDIWRCAATSGTTVGVPCQV